MLCTCLVTTLTHVLLGGSFALSSFFFLGVFNCSPGLITPRLIASKERYERLYFNEGKSYNRKHLNKLGTLLYRRENLFEKVQMTKTILVHC